MRQRLERMHRIPDSQLLHQTRNTANGWQSASDLWSLRRSNGFLTHIFAALTHIFAQKEVLGKIFGRNFTCFCAQLFAASLCVKFAFRQ